MMGDRIDPKYRIIAGLIGALGLAALATQVWVNAGRAGGLLVVLWGLAGFFTILTNTLVTGSMLLMALTGRRLSYDWMSMLTVSMVAVAVVFHVVLADLFFPAGLRWYTNEAFHTVMPAATVWFWLMETSRNPSRRGQPLRWLIWPALFGAYALTRGALTGWYPYPFLNVLHLGPASVAVNVAWLAAGFLAVSLLLHAIGQRMPLRDQPSER